MSEDSTNVGSALGTGDTSAGHVTAAPSLSRCPICRARLLDSTSCPRCGSDLSPLMQIAQHAHDLEQVAVAHLLNGEWVQAKAALVEVQSLRSSELSTQLLAFVEQQLLVSVGC